jgi:hypothetical protein
MKNLICSAALLLTSALATAQNPLANTNHAAVFAKGNVIINGGTQIDGAVFTMRDLENKVANFSIGSVAASNYTPSGDTRNIQLLVQNLLTGTQKVVVNNNGSIKIKHEYNSLTCSQSGSTTQLSKGGTVLAEGNISQSCSNIFGEPNYGNYDMYDKFLYDLPQFQACLVNSASYHYDLTNASGNQTINASGRSVTYVKMSAASFAAGNITVNGSNQSNNNIIVINVDGSGNAIDWTSNNLHISQPATQNTIINFYNTPLVTFSNTQKVHATILAPNSNVTMAAGSAGVQGQIICNVLTMNGGSINGTAFAGNYSCALYSIGNNVFNDINNDAVYQYTNGESGLDGVWLQLLDVNGVVVDEMVSFQYGQYYFYGVAPGTYSIKVEIPLFFNPSTAVRTTNLSTDNTNDGATVSGGFITTTQFTIGAGNASSSRYNIDFGFSRDTDQDGIVNSVDTDDDNDGILDTAENIACGGVSQPDAWGDEDGDGVPNLCDNDSPSVLWIDRDNSGIADAYDRDGDAICNQWDLDSDNDGILDAVETTVDTDKDGVPNFLDGDSDNDGITDVREASYANNDTDNNGVIDGTDPDRDGVFGVADPGEYIGNAFGAAGVTPVNTDGTVIAGKALGTDNIPDYLDIDSDNDAITDNIEAQLGCSYILPACGDTNCDGLFSVYDNTSNNLRQGMSFTLQNTDGSALPDYRDEDSDNDGSPDLIEATRITATGFTATATTGAIADVDGDGLADSYDQMNKNTAASNVVCKNTANRYFNTNGSTATVADAGSDTPLGGTGCSRGWRDPTILPVTLVNLFADVVNGTATIRWTVAGEYNMSNYQVERSTNGISFTTFDQVAANGKTNYQITDLLQASITYYRLRSISKDGGTQISSTITVRRDVKLNGEISIAPNPAINHFTISFKAEKESIANIRIMDMNGKTIAMEKRNVAIGNNTLSFNNAQQLAQGMYLVEMTTEGQKATTKLIVQK